MTPEQHIDEAERHLAAAEQSLRRTTVSADDHNWRQAATLAALATAHAAIAQAMIARERDEQQ